MSKRIGARSPARPTARPPAARWRTASGSVGYTRSSVGGMAGYFKGGRTYHAAASLSEKFDAPMDVGPNSVNGEILTMRARSRQAMVNFSYYKHAVSQLVSNVVGSGITPIIDDPELQILWVKFDSDIDVRGVLTAPTLVSQLAQHLFVDGEVFAVMIDTGKRNYVTASGIDYKVAIWEADHCPMGWHRQLDNGHWVRDGIEKDDLGRVVAYWLYTVHPKDWNATGKGSPLEPTRFDAEHVIHIYKPHRSTSDRGMPWGASSLPTLEMMRHYMLHEIEKKAIQSKHTLFYTSPAPVDGEGWDEEETPELINPDSGTATNLPPGHEVTFADMPPTDGNFGPYIRTAMTEVAVAFGISVEMLTYELGEVNDRSMRVQMLLMSKFFEHIGYGFIVPALRRFFARFVQRAYLLSLWSPPAGTTIEQHIKPEWMMAPRGHIQPVQDVEATIKAINAGLISREIGVAELGLNIRQIDRQNLKDFKDAKRTGMRYASQEGWKSEDADPVENIESIGAAIRAGLITPTADIETIMRARFGLPEMSAELKKKWEDEPFRAPITLAKPEDLNPSDPSDPAGQQNFSGKSIFS